MVNRQLCFMDWFFYNVVIIIKQCKITYKNVYKALLFSRNVVFRLKNSSSNYHRLKYFLLKFCTLFLLTNAYKSVFEISLILFKSWVICQNKKIDVVSTHSQKPGLLITQYLSISKQNKKKNPEHNFCRNC